MSILLRAGDVQVPEPAPNAGDAPENPQEIAENAAQPAENA